MAKQAIGLIGLGVMGENLARNIESRGYSVAVYNRTRQRTEQFLQGPAKGLNITGHADLGHFVDSLEKPRRIVIMVKAGSAVDEVIEQITRRLSRDDALLDGGNSHFQDTERRIRLLEQRGVRYLGVGISGGEEGALKGPCIMAGGSKEGYEVFEPVLTKIAARVDVDPCCAYLGGGGAGHYVKMVHNGIEYAMLQCIAEAYDIMITGLGLNVQRAQKLFAKWNDGNLESFLIYAAATVLGVDDADTKRPLVEMILDKAEQKGTGKWASQNAMDLGVPVPSIDAAVAARNISAFKEERIRARMILGKKPPRNSSDKKRVENALHDALLASIAASYAQGFALFRVASSTYGYELNLAEIAKIWRGGCIIRSKLLESIRSAYLRDAELPNLLMDKEFADLLRRLQKNWRLVLSKTKAIGIPTPAMDASLAYFDAYRREVLPANLIQGIRDYFGAHGYERTDKPGSFHTDWFH